MPVKYVICPACGGWIEAGSDDELVRLAKKHTLEVHHYDIPADHVLQSAEIDEASTKDRKNT